MQPSDIRTIRAYDIRVASEMDTDRLRTHVGRPVVPRSENNVMPHPGHRALLRRQDWSP